MRWLQFFLACVTIVTTTHAQMTPDLWRADLDTLAENLLEKHPNFYTKHSVEEFEDAMSALDAKIDQLDDQQIVMEICRLVAMGADSHTGAGFGPFEAQMRRLPIQMVVLDDGVFIHRATETHADLIGREIIAINNVAIDDVIDRVSVLFAWENTWKKINAGAAFASIVPALNAVGIVDRFDADSVSITIRDDENEKTINLATLVANDNTQRWRHYAELLADPPLVMRMSRGFYQSRFLEQPRAMYITYNQCKESDDLPMKKFVEFVMSKSDELDAQRIIIDLRYNGGGDETIIWPFMDALESSERFKEKGSVLVLTSRYTYSSAMSNAHQFKDRCGAILIGEPTSGKPNHFGQLGSFVLPNSRITIHHSTRYFHKVEGDPDAVHPDVRIETTSDDLFAGKDAVLDTALAYEPD